MMKLSYMMKLTPYRLECGSLLALWLIILRRPAQRKGGRDWMVR